MSPGCRKSGYANGSSSGTLRSVAIGWSVITVETINTSTSVSNPEVHDESFSFDLIAVVVFVTIPDISIVDEISLRDSRTAILLRYDSHVIQHLLQREMFVVDRLPL